jgi:hypothetical protein
MKVRNRNKCENLTFIVLAVGKVRMIPDPHGGKIKMLDFLFGSTVAVSKTFRGLFSLQFCKAVAVLGFRAGGEERGFPG